MRERDVKRVHKVIKMKGDSFWKEESNEYLFNDILNMLNEVNYDLRLVGRKRRRTKKY